MSAAEILKAAKALSSEEKMELIHGLFEDMEEKGADIGLTREQAAELEARLADLKANKADCIPLEQVESEMKKHFGW
jgi:putative addiction module component (TIGR02574 family)